MHIFTKALLGAGAASLFAACAETPKTASPDAAATSDAVMDAAPAQNGSADVEIGLDAANGNAPYFASVSSSYCDGGGRCGSGISLKTGNVDLSFIPRGVNTLITIKIDDDAYNAGYRFPSAGYDAVGVVTWKGDGDPPPNLVPLFGENAWPKAEFLRPVVTGNLRSVHFLDMKNDVDSYQYAVMLDGPGGRVLLDPRIINGGKNR